MNGTAEHPSPDQRELSEVQLAVANRVWELLYANTPASGFDYHGATLKEVQEYSEATLRNIEPAIQEENGIATGIAEQINGGYNHNVINDTLHFHRKTGATDYLRTIADVSALNYYGAVNQHIDLSSADEHVQQQCIALMKFAKLIDTFPEEGPSPFLEYHDDLHYDLRVIKDDQLERLIVDRPDDVERIAEIVLKHRTSNAAAINGILEGAFPPVAEGYL